MARPRPRPEGLEDIMADVDYSSPDHRLDNLTNMRFVRAYARLRHYILKDDTGERGTPWLKGSVEALDRSLAIELMLPPHMLEERLDDIGDGLCADKDGQDQAGFPTA